LLLPAGLAIQKAAALVRGSGWKWGAS
jgi:hypothetical protein